MLFSDGHVLDGTSRCLKQFWPRNQSIAQEHGAVAAGNGTHLLPTFTEQVVKLEDPGVFGGCSSCTTLPPLALAQTSREAWCVNAAVVNKMVSLVWASQYAVQ